MANSEGRVCQSDPDRGLFRSLCTPGGERTMRDVERRELSRAIEMLPSDSLGEVVRMWTLGLRASHVGRDVP